MDKHFGTRLQHTHARMGSQQQAISPKGTFNSNQLGKLEVTIPHKVDPILRPLQTQARNRLVPRRRPLLTNPNLLSMDKVVENLQKKKRMVAQENRPPPLVRSAKSEYRVVEDKDVPPILRDYRHKIIYKKLECLGHGAFARVFRVKAMDGAYYAVKVISKASLAPKNIRKKLYAEINIHRVLKHDYIVKFLSCFEDRHNIYLTLEFCENKTLNLMIKNRKRLTEDETRYYMGQILSALRYISDNRILHRDLKLSNVLLDANMDCKLGDFGLAALLLNSEDRKRTVCGTPHYIAPEILFNEGHNHRADMWSAGILMFNLLYGKHPFHHDEPNKLFNQVRLNETSKSSIFPPTGNFSVSEDARNLISSLLINDPDKRSSVIEALEHPFFSNHDIPVRIPQRAFTSLPYHHELFEIKHPKTSSSKSPASKVATAIRLAKDRNESFVDQRINPPLKIMDEVILDPRTQYPIKLEPLQHASLIPVESTSESTSKKRSNNDRPKVSKRVCSDIDMKATVHQESSKNVEELPRAENLDVRSSPVVIDSRPFAVPLPLPNRKPIMEEMADNLKTMMNRATAISKYKLTDSVEEDKNFEWNRENVFVATWIDCTPQYGFSYTLSDGTLGLLYNDKSTITTVDSKQFYYIYTRLEDGRYIESIYDQEVPPDLKKKCFILARFKEYLENNMLPLDMVVPQATETTKIHIFKYIVTEACIAFRLNNGVIQFNFFRHDKLVLYDKGKKLIYIDDARDVHHYKSLDVLSSNKTRIIELLYFAFDILQGQNKERQDALRGLRWDRMEKQYNIESLTSPHSPQK